MPIVRECGATVLWVIEYREEDEVGFANLFVYRVCFVDRVLDLNKIAERGLSRVYI